MIPYNKYNFVRPDSTLHFSSTFWQKLQIVMENLASSF